jgi:hypothetical protein
MTIRTEDLEITDTHGRRRKARDGEMLQDGETIRVPVTLRDSDDVMRRAMLDHFGDWQHRMQRDSAGDHTAPALLHRPGFVTDVALHRPGLVTHATSDAIKRAYAEAEAADTHAWMNLAPHFHDAATGELANGREGDVCTISGPENPNDFGSSETLRYVDGRLVCVPNKKARSDAAPRDDREEAYAEYDRDAADAWRKGPR